MEYTLMCFDNNKFYYTLVVDRKPEVGQIVYNWFKITSCKPLGNNRFDVNIEYVELDEKNLPIHSQTNR